MPQGHHQNFQKTSLAGGEAGGFFKLLKHETFNPSRVGASWRTQEALTHPEKTRSSFQCYKGKSGSIPGKGLCSLTLLREVIGNVTDAQIAL